MFTRGDRRGDRSGDRLLVYSLTSDRRGDDRLLVNTRGDRGSVVTKIVFNFKTVFYCGLRSDASEHSLLGDKCVAKSVA